jgi:hypothetical protein
LAGTRQASVFQTSIQAIAKAQQQAGNATKDTNALQNANNIYIWILLLQNGKH